MIAMLMPQLLIDMSLGVERRHEFIAVTRRSAGEFLRAGEIDLIRLKSCESFIAISLRGNSIGSITPMRLADR